MRSENLKYRLYQRITALAPPRLAAFLDWRLVRDKFGSPLNGQTRRAAMFAEIFGAISFRAVVETGTFAGTTTEYLRAVSRLPVVSIEIQPRFYHFARRRFRDDPAVSLELCDSRVGLERLARRTDFPHDTVFFYLDAHWGELPLKEEVELIRKHWTQPVIVIDDFEVPDDGGYGFDDQYEQKLNLSYLGDLGDLEVFWPAAHSSEESGAKRGCVVLARRGIHSQNLAKLSTLRPHARAS